MSASRHVEITGESIELYKLLKLEGLAESGGEAKLVVAEGLVLVNGEVEIRKRKKIVPGDVVEWAGEVMRVRQGARPA